MTVPAHLSLTQSQAFTALGDFIASILPAAVGVIQGQANRVAEPGVPNFVVMTALRQDRLGFNETDYNDTIFVGEIEDTTLTVTDVTQFEGGGILAGMTLIDTADPTNIESDTVVIGQVSGAPGGIGVYTISPTQTVTSEAMYAGQSAALVPTRWTVQLDIHGPASGDNAKVIEGLFRSEVAIDSFIASGFDVAPLYCDEAMQLPFINGENQYEDRYVMSACMQINPIIGTPQQFAEELDPTVVDVGEAYPL